MVGKTSASKNVYTSGTSVSAANTSTSTATEAEKKSNEKKFNGELVCAYSGKRGAFAEQAITRYFDGVAKPLALDSFREIFQMVQDGRVDFGMIPIENTLAGSVHENYDNFTQFEDISSVGSVLLRIQHALLAVKGASLDSIKNIYTHPQALHQCEKFLSLHKDWNKLDCVSTASAASVVADLQSIENAAIASSVNASNYNLEVLQENIEDDSANFTRFVVIQANHSSLKESEPYSDSASYFANMGARANTASFVFSVKNEAGALYNCLGVFLNHKMNLSRLESRPIAGQPWRYRFYADARIDSENPYEYVNEVFASLSEVAENVRLLGVYAESEHHI